MTVQTAAFVETSYVSASSTPPALLGTALSLSDRVLGAALDALKTAWRSVLAVIVIVIATRD